MFDLPANTELAPTGLPWCPEVPSRWSLVRNKSQMVRRSRPVGSDFGEYQLLSLTKRGIIRRDFSTGKGKLPASFETYQVVERGDIVMCLFDVDETPRTVGRARSRGMITGAYDRFVARDDATAEFLTWFYIAVDDAKGLRALYRGLRKTVPVDAFLAAKVPLPPAEEQAAIVKYLAYANARIDSAIAAKRSLIDLTRQQLRVATHELLMGMNRTRPQFDSGIPWVGSIPSEWELVPARYLFRPVSRAVVDPELPQLSLTRSEGLIESGSEGTRTQAAEDIGNLQAVAAGDFVLNKYRAHLGLFRWSRGPGLVTRNYTVLEPTQRVDRGYFELLFQDPVFSDGLRINSRGVGDGMSPLYTSTLLSMKMPLPDIAEQRAIATQVAELGEPLRRTEELATKEIALLGEYRMRLMSDVVTGQVDVREVASSLPALEVPEVDLVGDGDESEVDDVLYFSEV